MDPSRNAALTGKIKYVASWINRNRATYNKIATYIWDHPELGLGEFKSSAKLRQYLARNGFKIETGVAEMATAFVAAKGSGKPVLGIMAEFDALPDLSQEAGVTVRKPVIPGAPGHGCGHNLFGTSSVLAAVGLAKTMAKYGIEGTVKVFGTPAEETLIGKVYMNRDGVFDGTDVMISCHPMDKTGVDYTSCLAMDNMKFRFFGKASHAGAAPEAGRSALDGVELMNIAANYMREHIIQDARIHYVITKGGEAPNIVPAFAEVWYYIRAPRRAQVDEIRGWLIDIAKGAALMTRTTMEFQLLTAVCEWLPNKTLSHMGDEVIRLIGPPAFTPEDQEFGRAVIESMGKSTGEEAYASGIETPDFSKTFPHVEITKGSKDVNYTWRFPSVEFLFASIAKGTPLHSWQAACQTGAPPALKAGLQVSKYMAAAGIVCLMDPKVLKDARDEIDGYRTRYGYEEPLPKEVKVPTFKEIYG